MKLQQLLYLHEIVNRGLNISNAAAALHTSQPSVSRQIQMLEEELGLEVFVRSKKRIVGLTPPGMEVLRVAKRMLHDAHNLSRIGQDFTTKAAGELTIAASHTHARYVLPSVVKKFAALHPNVNLTLRQGSPAQMARWVCEGHADLAISTQPVNAMDDVLFLECYTVDRLVLVPPSHPLLRVQRLTLDALAPYPLITYDTEFIGYTQDINAFEQCGLKANVVLRATDADVIKTYVKAGLGVAIIAALAYDAKEDRPLKALDAKHLFAPNVIVLQVRKHQYLRDYAYDFIELFTPRLTRAHVKKALFHE